jgi:hypothetical protein
LRELRPAIAEPRSARGATLQQQGAKEKRSARPRGV